eukprot:3425152-Rhodomonas_salina.3
MTCPCECGRRVARTVAVPWKLSPQASLGDGMPEYTTLPCNLYGSSQQVRTQEAYDWKDAKSGKLRRKGMIRTQQRVCKFVFKERQGRSQVGRLERSTNRKGNRNKSMPACMRSKASWKLTKHRESI